MGAPLNDRCDVPSPLSACSLMVRLLVSGTALLALAAEATAPGTYGQPDVTKVRLSPDGSRVVMLRPVDGALQPFIGDLEKSSGLHPIRVNPRRAPRCLAPTAPLFPF